MVGATTRYAARPLSTNITRIVIVLLHFSFYYSSYKKKGQISTSKPSSFFVSLSERLIIAATHMNIFIFIFILFGFCMFSMLAIHEYNLHTIFVPTFSKYDKLHTYS